ncbi:ShlB/FhaC/HecB family hemolysin secretion/activation protein [Aquabacter sp. P-9]|uniref:ShlB/FhaC/HecB family hemolysin secretion/activation protein n=1 Tax=Aquabacter sediminis TaxID=3029197 RepID=UPI00237DF364|nr:ShlB/FhaC/HecB family hemolysin secretion/activation protein [Aquabacter sp. P-9]MDE1569391.1 ShlB/FhaC/HecB family hemolysin secretion/activation protein [Aquabacter sp. P-9]
MRRIPTPALATSSLALLALAAAAAPAFAQRAAAPVERNLPPVISGQGRLMVGPQDLALSQDETPLGVALRGIRLLGPKDSIAGRTRPGIAIGNIGDLPHAGLEQALQPFLGRPVTRKLIGEVQAAISKVYRAAGYPFVSVSLPPQEITGGILTLQVVEFKVGGVRVQGGDPAIAGQVRAVPGQRISAEALDEDLNWLNRTPYRTVSGVFAPGDAVGLSTLTLEVTQQKPWQVFAGWSNTGTHATSFDRYFVGFGAALTGLRDSYVSYQMTGSWDFWSDQGSVGTGPQQPLYYSQAGRVVLGLGDRQSLEIVPSYVASRQAGTIPLFSYTYETLEVPVYYRTAISNLLPGTYLGDLVLGVTGKGVNRGNYFTGEGIGGAQAGLFELVLGWSISKPDEYGLTSLDLKLFANPGGVVGGNDSQSWIAYSGGRVTDVNYVYAAADISRVTRLPAGFSWVSAFSGIAAGQALPDTEQISLGGMYATRGYTLDDGNADTGFFWRNELRTPTFPLLSGLGLSNVADQVSPFAFLDVGWGHSYGYQGVLGPVTSQNVSMAGIGVGLDYSLARNVTASFIAGVALTDAIYTQAGDVTLQGRIYISY